MTLDTEKQIVDTVQVALRIRPLVESEIARGCEDCVETYPEERQVQVKGLAFTYNHVFPPNVTQETFYNSSIRSLLDKLEKGYNVTILAYGQTGSGKTHSMGTAYSTVDSEPHEAGVIPRAVSDIFDTVERNSHEFKYLIKVSFLELYQEQLYDLLSSKSREQSVIEIREENKNIVLPGLTEEIVMSADETLRHLMRASEGRATGATAMNSHSSRSHAIFTITIIKENIANKNSSTTSKFHLVDLAGSERSKKTKATGDRFKEGVKINQGLLALGNVISALGDGSNRSFVSYRDSKLTRLLQDSLGGNSVTLMIACISPADYNLEETVSTLRYADRARQIRNKPIINQDPKAAEINRLNGVIQQLRLQILNTNSAYGDDSNIFEKYNKEVEKNKLLQQKCDEIIAQNKKLTHELQNALNMNTTLVERAFAAEASKDIIENKMNELSTELDKTMDIFRGKNSTDSELSENKAYTSMCKIRSKIGELKQEQDKVSRMIFNITNDDEIKEEDTDNKPIVDCEDNETSIVEKERAHTFDQVAKSNELRDLVKSLKDKITLAEKLSENNQELEKYNEDMKVNENRIAELENEKDDLTEQLRVAQTTKRFDPKQVDGYRSKINNLETEITTLRKKCAEMSTLIKLKEKNDTKIKTLQNEIQQMKAAKVRLIKSMKAEGDRFRAWKLQNEKKLIQLTNKDRKMQSTIVKMENQHSKQQNVLKRRVEEAVSANRKLKEALERQRNAQKRHQSAIASKTEVVQQWVDEELEFKGSLAIAEYTLKGLMEDRGILTQELSKLRATDPNDPDINALEDDISLRNAQISDLQEKIVSGNNEQKAKNNCESIQSMAEAKCAIKYLLEIAAESKKEKQLNRYQSEQENAKLEEWRQMCKEANNKLVAFEDKLTRENNKHKRELAILDRQHEEKITTLIKQLNNDERNSADSSNRDLLERLEILKDAFERAQNTKNDLEEENSALRQENELLKVSKKKAPKAKSDKSKVEIKKWDTSEDEEEPQDDSFKDPNWKKTPRFKRIQKSKLSEEHPVAVKRNSEGKTKCSCKTVCGKRCGCRKVNSHCSSDCKCSSETCENRANENESRSSNSSNDDEDLSENTNSGADRTFKIENKAIRFLKLENDENDSSLLNSGKRKRSFFYSDVQ